MSISRKFALWSGLLLALPMSSEATTWNVPGDMSNTCTMAMPSCDTITAAVANALAGDDVQVAAGTYNENAIVVDKQLTINGADAMTTIVDAGANTGFQIRANGIVLSNLTIQNGADGVRIETAGVDDLEVDTVRFLSNSQDGIQIGDGAGTFTNIRVLGSTFSMNSTGIRIPTTSIVDGLTVTDSTFTANSLGIYLSNEGAGSSRLDNLLVSGCHFEGHTGVSAIFLEELRDSTVEMSTFVDNPRDFLLFKAYTSSGVSAGNISIRDNEFTDSLAYSVSIISQGQSLGAPVTIEDNLFTQDVGALTSNDARVDVRLGSAFTHAAVNVTGNRMLLSGTFATAVAAYGVQVRGNGPVNITENLIDGGGSGGAGNADQPPSAGIFVRSQDTSANFAAIPSGATITATCNRITGWQHGIVAYDAVNDVLGGLTAGADVSANENVISGNALSGVANGGSPTVDAENNFWGCAAGPGNLGCDGVIGAVDFMPVGGTAPECAPRADGVPCDTGDQCVSEFCVDGVCCAEECAEEGASCNLPASPGTCVDDIGDPCAAPDECDLGFCVDGVCCDEECTAEGATCAAPAAPGTCVDDIGDGCTDDMDCDLGFCVDGVCCDAACDASGAICTLPTAPGTCVDDLGDPCTSGTECTLGFCVDEVCCIAESCEGTCGDSGFCENPAPAPALSSWSLAAALSLLLAVAALALLRRRV